MEKNTNLLKLHKYCLILILTSMRIQDVGKMMRVCKQIKDIFELDSIWEKLTLRDFKNEGYRELFGNWKETYKFHYMVKKKEIKKKNFLN